MKLLAICGSCFLGFGSQVGGRETSYMCCQRDDEDVGKGEMKKELGEKQGIVMLYS